MRPYPDGPFEVGAGRGDLTSLLRHEHTVVAPDLSEPCLEDLNSRLAHDLGATVASLDLTKRPLERELRAQSVDETEFGSA